MAISNRNVTIKSIFAVNANTTIPSPPVAGSSYRNESVTTQEIAAGWPYKEIVDSGKFNEAMYEYTTICKLLEEYGFLPWSPYTDYPAQGCAMGTDGNVYQAKVATGPNTTAVDPVTDTSHNIWDLFYYSDFAADRAIISNGNGKLTASSITATQLSYLDGVTSAIQAQINAKAADNAVVHLAGAETITGNKTFSGELIKSITSLRYSGFRIQNTQVTKGTTPSPSVGGLYVFQDKDGLDLEHRLGGIETMYGQDGIITRVTACEPVANSTTFSWIGVIYPNSGNPYTYAPASDRAGSIVTTVNKSKAANGYFQFGNGMIVQWGRVTGITSNTETTVTFPKAFSSSTSYTIVKNYQSNRATEAADREMSFYSMTATSAKTFTASGDTNSFSWLAIGY